MGTLIANALTIHVVTRESDTTTAIDGGRTAIPAEVAQLGHPVATFHAPSTGPESPGSGDNGGSPDGGCATGAGPAKSPPSWAIEAAGPFGARSIFLVSCGAGPEGVETVREVRRRMRDHGIIALGPNDPAALAALLDAGADLAIPDTSPELVRAGVQALGRRLLNDWAPGERIHLDSENSTVRMGGTLVKLRRAEFRICEYLLSNRGRWVSRGELLQAVLGKGEACRTSVVRVHVRRIRRALAPFGPCVLSERGKGYRFVVPSDAPG